MQWFLLILAGVFEVAWAIAMKYSNGFTVLIPSVITVVGYIASAVEAMGTSLLFRFKGV